MCAVIKAKGVQPNNNFLVVTFLTWQFISKEVINRERSAQFFYLKLLYVTFP